MSLVSVLTVEAGSGKSYCAPVFSRFVVSLYLKSRMSAVFWGFWDVVASSVLCGDWVCAAHHKSTFNSPLTLLQMIDFF